MVLSIYQLFALILRIILKNRQDDIMIDFQLVIIQLQQTVPDQRQMSLENNSPGDLTNLSIVIASDIIVSSEY